MIDTRRRGDTRPFVNGAATLTLVPSHPIRWLPRHGQPGCLIEWISQTSLTLIARLPIYAALVVMLTLLSVLWFHL